MVLLIAVMAFADDNLGYDSSIFFLKTPTRSQNNTEVLADTNTATLGISTTTTRLEWTIMNLTGASDTVYYGTYPATSKSGLWPLPANSSYSDDTNCWPGPIYVLTEPGGTPVTVYFIEKWR